MLMELVPEGGKQSDLFGYLANRGKKDQLMTTMDRINKKYSRGILAKDACRQSTNLFGDCHKISGILA